MGIIDGVIDETLDVEKVDVYGMRSVTSTSGNPPGSFSGFG